MNLQEEMRMWDMVSDEAFAHFEANILKDC